MNANRDRKESARKKWFSLQQVGIGDRSYSRFEPPPDDCSLLKVGGCMKRDTQAFKPHSGASKPNYDPPNRSVPAVSG